MTILSIKIIIALSLRVTSLSWGEVFLVCFFFSLPKRVLMAFSIALATRHHGTEHPVCQC